MRKTSAEAWLLVAMIIVLIVSVFIVGLIAVKVYRVFKPIEPPEFASSIVLPESDGFFKIFFVGILLCSPGLYFVYDWLF